MCLRPACFNRQEAIMFCLNVKLTECCSFQLVDRISLSLCCDVYLSACASFCVEIFLVAVFCIVQSSLHYVRKSVVPEYS